MPLSTDDLAWFKIGNVRARFNNFAYKLVADDHRHWNYLGRPGVPLVDVYVGSANARAINPYQEIIDADRWFRHFF